MNCIDTVQQELRGIRSTWEKVLQLSVNGEHRRRSVSSLNWTL